MSHLTRYPVPQGTAAGKVDGPRIVLPTVAAPDPIFASEFDGANDWLNRASNLSGISDSKTGLMSFWYLSSDDASPNQIIYQGQSGAGIIIRLQKQADDTLDFFLFNRGSATTLLNLLSTTALKVIDGWNHILISWDMNTATSRAELYLNDVDDSNIITGPVDGDADYSTATAWFVGSSSAGGSVLLNGCLSQFYFNSSETLDLSITANRRKFINANLTPVDLGPGGSTPTGHTPISYLNKTAANFHLNGGTGGDFTQNGTLTVCPPPHGAVTLQPLRGLEALEAGAVDDPRLSFRLEPTIVPTPVLDFLQPLRATEQGLVAGAVDNPRLHFRLAAAAAATNRLLLINPPGLDGGFGTGLSL